jgi:hypothetical protein
MEINLAAKNNDVKDNDPGGDLDIGSKRIKYKTQDQKKCIHNDCTIAQDHQGILQPG